MVSLYFICITIVEIIMYLFHFSVLFLLILKRNEVFIGQFYSILRIIFIADFVYFINRLITYKLSLIIPSFFDFEDLPYLPTTIFNIASYAVLADFLGYTLIAFNLFTFLWFQQQHERIWKGYWYKVVLICLPFLHICWRLHEPSKYAYFPNGVIYVSFYNEEVSAIIFGSITAVYMATALITVIFNILSYMKIICYKQKFSIQPEIENSLLVVSLITFSAQTLRALVAFGFWFFPNNEVVAAILAEATPLIVNAFAWSGSLALFYTSSLTRKSYYQLYFPTKNRTILIKKISIWIKKL